MTVQEIWRLYATSRGLVSVVEKMRPPFLDALRTRTWALHLRSSSGGLPRRTWQRLANGSLVLLREQLLPHSLQCLLVILNR
jgi:hypothetical protein